MAETLLKKQVRPMFEKNWKEHYQVKALTKLGYERKICKSCGDAFWTLDSSKEICSDSSCMGVSFLGKKTKEYSYTECWKKIEKFFEKNGHTSIPRYPVIPRWRSDLYFTNASIIDFQPYVVNGEVKPPADPLIVPQTSIRFGDVSNVGVTGTHYTTFVMFGQHAFNTDSKKPYFKEEALGLDFDYLIKVIGVKEKDLIFKEDVWEGGGYFGPSMEYFANGVELGNCVFMEFQDLKNGTHQKLKRPVIDMGAGYERLAWYTNGTPTSYDITFREVLDYLKKKTKIKFDNNLLLKFYKDSSKLNADEVKNLEKEQEKIAEELGYSRKELFEILDPVFALYAISDHTKTLLYTSTDGLLPSNSGGGYNLRIIARRIFDMEEKFGFDLDLNEIFRIHVDSLKEFDPTVVKGYKTACDVLEEERRKYKESKNKAESKLKALFKSGKTLNAKEIVRMYKSDGITKEQIVEVSKSFKKEVEIPANYFELISQDNDTNKVKEDSKLDKLLEKENKEIIKMLPNTKKLYYDDLKESTAKVIYSSKNFVILDKTVFYPEGGGQAFDKGTIDGSFNVLEVYNYEGKILHFIDSKEKSFKVGQSVILLVNEARQRQLRSQHTGAHLLNAACREVLGNHVWQAGAYKDLYEAHLDITHYKQITDEEIKQIEDLVNSWIFESIDIKIYELSKDEAEKKYGFRLYQGGAIPGNSLRLIEILGIDIQACAGLHLDNTSKVGVFKIIKRNSIQDGVIRITYTTFKSALKYIREKEEILENTSNLLSVSSVELFKTVNGFFKDWKEQRKNIDKLQHKIAEYETNSIIGTQDKKVIAKFSLDGPEILKIFKKLKDVPKAQDKIIAIYNNNSNVFIWKGPKSKTEISEIISDLEKKLSKKIKGGGKDLFCGKLF